MHVAHACSQFSEHSRSLHRRTHMCVYISRCGRFSANRQLNCKVPWFRGSLSPIGGLRDILPKTASQAPSKNRAIPTFPLEELLRRHGISITSRADRGRTAPNQEIAEFSHTKAAESGGCVFKQSPRTWRLRSKDRLDFDAVSATRITRKTMFAAPRMHRVSSGR